MVFLALILSAYAMPSYANFRGGDYLVYGDGHGSSDLGLFGTITAISVGLLLLWAFITKRGFLLGVLIYGGAVGGLAYAYTHWGLLAGIVTSIMVWLIAKWAIDKWL